MGSSVTESGAVRLGHPSMTHPSAIQVLMARPPGWCVATTRGVSRADCLLDLDPMDGRVRDDSSERKQREGSTGNSMFDIIGVVVVVLAIFGIRRARVGIGV